MTRTIIRAIVCGALIVSLPLDWVIGTSILWLPALAWAAWRQGSGKSRFAFVAIVGVMITAAAAVPNRSLARRYGPFPKTEVTLGQLREAHAIFIDPSEELKIVKLPSVNPTLFEIAHAVTNQTNLRGRMFRCGNGPNLIIGPDYGPVKLRLRD